MTDKEVGPIDRRTVLKAAGAAGVVLAASAFAATPRKRYVIVGVGSRAHVHRRHHRQISRGQ